MTTYVLAVGTHGVDPAGVLILAILVVLVIVGVIAFTALAAFTLGLFYGPLMLLVLRKKRHLFWMMPLINLLLLIGFWYLYLYDPGSSSPSAVRPDTFPEPKLIFDVIFLIVTGVLVVIAGWLNATLLVTVLWAASRRRKKTAGRQLLTRNPTNPLPPPVTQDGGEQITATPERE